MSVMKDMWEASLKSEAQVVDILPFIAADNTLCWACPIGYRYKPQIKLLLPRWRFRVEFLDNGNLYVSDSILHTNGYMMSAYWLFRFSDGSALSFDIVPDGFKPAGRFCNYEEDPDNG